MSETVETGTSGETVVERDSATSKPGVREWARANGFPNVKDTGRLSDQVRDAYAGAHPSA